MRYKITIEKGSSIRDGHKNSRAYVVANDVAIDSLSDLVRYGKEVTPSDFGITKLEGGYYSNFHVEEDSKNGWCVRRITGILELESNQSLYYFSIKSTRTGGWRGISKLKPGDFPSPSEFAAQFPTQRKLIAYLRKKLGKEKENEASSLC